MSTNFFKTTKWWMYLPFTCMTFPLVKWAVSAQLQTDRVKRILFIFANLYWTLMVMLFVIVLIFYK